MMEMLAPAKSKTEDSDTLMEVGKRRIRDSSDDSGDEFSSGMDVTPTKRQKLPSGNSLPHHIGESELASAFALASLASMSPNRSSAPASPSSCYSVEPESREEEGESNAPGAPDVRSPVRSPGHYKRVTFSTDTRDISRQGARRFSLPPRSRRGPPRHNICPPNAPWLRPRVMDHNHPGGYAMPMPPPDKWICDYCNVAAFDSYQEACAHEEVCRTQYHHHRQPQHHGHWPVMPHSMVAFPGQRHHREPQRSSPPGVPQRRPSPAPSSTMGPPPPVPVPSGSRTWFDGSTSLAIPSSDSEWLSPMNCFIRDECVEAFSATEDDVATVSKRGRITTQQVGIRCRFCKHRPRDETLSAATSYPVSLAGIYESVKRWQKVHMEACKDVPPDTRAKLQELASNNSWVPTTRQYWADSARALGMVDTQDGIRFGTDPLDAQARQAFVEKLHESSGKTDKSDHDEKMQKDGTLADGESIVYLEDMEMVPPYVYFLMRQVEATHFTESDRFVARSKGPVGYVRSIERSFHPRAHISFSQDSNVAIVKATLGWGSTFQFRRRVSRQTQHHKIFTRIYSSAAKSTHTSKNSLSRSKKKRAKLHGLNQGGDECSLRRFGLGSTDREVSLKFNWCLAVIIQVVGCQNFFLCCHTRRLTLGMSPTIK